MTSKWLVLLLLGCCMMAAMARRWKGGGRGRRNPVLRAACLVTNSTNHVMKNRTCLAGQTCDLGPLAVPDCKSTTLYARFCRGTPLEGVDGKNRRRRLIRASVSRLACRLQSTDGRGTIDVTKPCQNATCTLGPLFMTVNNTQVQAMFCERPVTAESCVARQEDRLRDILERIRQEGHDRKQRFRREIRPEDILSALGRGGYPDIGVCRVRDENGNWLDGSRTCPTGGAGCNIGPVRKYTISGVQERWFCEDDQEWMADRACNLKFDNYEERPENAAARCRIQGGACAIGPVELDLPDGAADAFFCIYPNLGDAFSPDSQTADSQTADIQSTEESEDSLSVSARSFSKSFSLDSLSEDSFSAESFSADSASQDGPALAGPPSGPAQGGPPSGPAQGGPPSGPALGGPPSGPAQGGLFQGGFAPGSIEKRNSGPPGNTGTSNNGPSPGLIGNPGPVSPQTGGRGHRG